MLPYAFLNSLFNGIVSIHILSETKIMLQINSILYQVLIISIAVLFTFVIS